LQLFDLLANTYPDRLGLTPEKIGVPWSVDVPRGAVRELYAALRKEQELQRLFGKAVGVNKFRLALDTLVQSARIREVDFPVQVEDSSSPSFIDKGKKISYPGLDVAVSNLINGITVAVGTDQLVIASLYSGVLMVRDVGHPQSEILTREVHRRLKNMGGLSGISIFISHWHHDHVEKLEDILKFASVEKIPVQLIVGEKVIDIQMMGYFLANSDWLTGAVVNNLTVRCLKSGVRYAVFKTGSDNNTCMVISEPPKALAHFIPSYQIQTFNFKPIYPRYGQFSAIVYTRDINFQLDSDPSARAQIILAHLVAIATQPIDEGIEWINHPMRPGAAPNQCSAMVVIYFDQGHLGFDRFTTKSLMAEAMHQIANAKSRLEKRFEAGTEIKFIPGHQKCACGTGRLEALCLPANLGRRPRILKRLLHPSPVVDTIDPL
jgi:hypothetical protein